MPRMTNEERAEHGNTAVSAYVVENGENGNDFDDLVDMLASVRHWADRQGIDFDAALERATMHYQDEIDEEAASE